jgi:hypothetical protein
VRDGTRLIEQVETHERGDLIVAAAAGAELAPQLGAGDLDQAPFERTVHVFVRLDGLEAAIGDVCGERVERMVHALEFIRGQVAGRVERCGMGLRTRDVIGRQDPVEVRGLAERLQGRGRATREAATPEGSARGGPASRVVDGHASSRDPGEPRSWTAATTAR